MRTFTPRLSLIVFAALLVACAPAQSPPGSGRVVAVVAAENFWGSLAAQLGGTHAAVQSIVTDPNADPHEYESSAADARAFATAGLVIVNGAGYDDWAEKLLAANPTGGRVIIRVADLVGQPRADNPHFWYGPAYVDRVVGAITDALQKEDTQDKSYFAQQRTLLENRFVPFHARIAEIRSRFSGAPVGATEDIFVYLAQALGLDLVSPREFMRAVAEGNEPPVRSVALFQGQITGRHIRVLVYNVQTSTLVTTNLRSLATQNAIPVVGISETLQPPSATFEDWQEAQLSSLEKALRTNTH